jgi:hypothetical protein
MNTHQIKPRALRILGVLCILGCSPSAFADPDQYRGMAMNAGFVTHIHSLVIKPGPRSTHKFPRTVPPGQAAEVWYLATQKMLDGPEPRQRRYCVYPRIEITGTAAWTDPFVVRLTGILAPVTSPSVTVPVPLPPNTSRELASSADWCVTAAATGRPPALKIVTDYGSAEVRFSSLPP